MNKVQKTYLIGCLLISLLLVLIIILFFVREDLFIQFWGIIFLSFLMLSVGICFLAQIFKSDKQNECNAECSHVRPLVHIKDIVNEQEIQKSEPVAEFTKNTNVKNEVYDERFEKWSKAMYEGYATQWNSFFTNVKYPFNQAEKAELAVMLWKISSLTMDYLMTVNNDPNTLRKNRELTEAIINGEEILSLDYKEFYGDPTTVPHKAIIIYDLLSSLLDDKQSFDVVAFGYKLNLKSNNQGKSDEQTSK